MEESIDVRGLSCPQPVIITLEKIKSAKQDRFKILVDTDTAKENIGRMVRTVGWEIVEVEPQGSGYVITVAKVS